MSSTTTVQSTGGSLGRTFVLGTGDLSIITCYKFTGSPPASTFVGITGADNGASSRFGQFIDPPNNGDNVAMEYKVGVTGTGLVMAMNGTTSGRWVHVGYTLNNTTGVQHIYAIFEGFSQTTPMFLVNFAPGATTSTFPNRMAIFDDGDGDIGTGVSIGHYIAVSKELTQAQVLAQFAQRLPTATVTSAAYTYLDMTDSTNPQVDLGTTATNFTIATPGFTPDSTQPSDWVLGVNVPGTGAVSYVTA